MIYDTVNKHKFNFNKGKKFVLCVIGESGSGKSEIAKYLSENYSLHYVKSKTDRPTRTDDSSHIYLTKLEFDFLEFSGNELLAKGYFGGYRYATTSEDYSDKNVFVVDEQGYLNLLKDHKNLFDVVGLRVTANEDIRLQRVGNDKSRLERDVNKFLLSKRDFPYHVENNHDFAQTQKKLDMIMEIINYLKEQ